MDSPVFKRLSSASELPVQWDEIAASIFQKKDFLLHADVYNPCMQRYYLYCENDDLRAAACVYTLGVDLFTFKKIPSRLPMQIIGLPVSVSTPGIFGRTYKDIESLIKYILKIEKGLILCLNLDKDVTVGPSIGMTMLPTVLLDLPFQSWDNYVQSFRSHYRRRALHILEAFEGVKKVSTDCSFFTVKHHDLYLQILNRTPNKLELLSVDYFRNLRDPFRLTSFYYNDQLLCWHINCADGDKLCFFFGGHDYKLLERHQSYFNNLFSIIREGIEGGYHHLDLGQTSEIAKMKAGGQLIAKELFLYSRNSIIRFLLKIGRPLLAYHPVPIKYNALKKISY